MEHKRIKLISQVFKSARKHLEDRGYTEIFVPRVVRATGACENVNTLFEVYVDGNYQWFGKRSYLAQTGQLYLEALVPSLNKVYCQGPSFRAEAKVDNRHLTEFQMIEIELSGGFDDLLEEIEELIKKVASDLVFLSGQIDLGLTTENIVRLKKLPDRFPKLTYDEAIALLQKLGQEICWGDDISSSQEKTLVRYFGNQPLFITRYPDPTWDFGKEIEVEKFFNMLPDKQNPGRVLSSDLILPYGGESVGSAARVHLAEEMETRLLSSRMFKRLKEMGGGIEDFSWYIDQLKKGSVPHAGCGFGMARIIQWLLGSDDIRSAVTFPSNKESLI
jgi:asparaginyl-tRNA synthetase